MSDGNISLILWRWFDAGQLVQLELSTYSKPLYFAKDKEMGRSNIDYKKREVKQAQLQTVKAKHAQQQLR